MVFIFSVVEPGLGPTVTEAGSKEHGGKSPTTSVEKTQQVNWTCPEKPPSPVVVIL
jgi:hypothetical protein